MSNDNTHNSPRHSRRDFLAKTGKTALVAGFAGTIGFIGGEVTTSILGQDEWDAAMKVAGGGENYEERRKAFIAKYLTPEEIAKKSPDSALMMACDRYAITAQDDLLAGGTKGAVIVGGAAMLAFWLIQAAQSRSQNPSDEHTAGTPATIGR